MKKLLRLAKWVPVVAFAFIAGAVWRQLRRIFRRTPRIWHGQSPLFWEPYIVLTDRRAGYPSEAYVHDLPPQRALQETYPDAVHIVRPSRFVGPDEIHWRFFVMALLHADINFTYFDAVYFTRAQPRLNELALRILRAAGIRTVVAAHGGDVTYRHRYRSRFDWIQRVQEQNPAWDLVATAPETLSRIHAYCRTAAMVLPAYAAHVRLLPRNDLLFLYVPIDTDALRAAPPDAARDVPLIVHAPSSRPIKGTEFILAALDRLRARGYRFELKLVEKLPRPEALKIYGDADVIVDQLCIGAYGTLSLEGMALGKPVITYLDQETLGDPVFNVPLVNAHRENIEEALAALIRCGELRHRIGIASRRSMERYHSIEAMAVVYDRIYRHVWWNEPLRLDDTAIFDPARPARSFTEDATLAEYWPVPVDDLMTQIGDAVGEVRRARTQTC